MSKLFFGCFVFSHVGIKQLVFGGKHLGDWDDDLTTGEDGLKSYKIWNCCTRLAAFLLQSQKWLADLEVSAHCRYSQDDIQTTTSTCFWQQRLEMWSSWHEDGSENLVQKFWEAFTMVVLWLALEDAKIEIFLWSQSTLACIIHTLVDESNTMCSVWFYQLCSIRYDRFSKNDENHLYGWIGYLVHQIYHILVK